jgi:RNA polymerase sigma factor (sigma-70 family)
MATSAVSKVLQGFRRAVLVRDGADQTDGQLLGRFIEQRDEAAFEALVRRHGAMIMGICRRVLDNQQDAEDAFQATFLVLVRKAASVSPREMVANWLYGVARQSAIRARALNAARWEREKQLATMVPMESRSQEHWDELRPLLDQELSRLPDKFRVAVVLCDLEGKTRKEAARQLGWPEGSVSSRLARARTLLAGRLSRRGVALSSAMLAELISANAASASTLREAWTPAELLVSTVKAASLVTTGQAHAGAISTRVAFLADRVVRAMFMSKLKSVAAVLLAIGMAIAIPGYGVPLLNNRAAGQEPRKFRPAPAVQVAAVQAAAPQARAQEPKLRATLDGEKDGTAVAISGDGKVVARECEDEIVKLWDVAAAKDKATLETMHKPPVRCLALSGDGKVLATCGAEGVIKLWDVAKAREMAVLKGHTDKVTAVAISSDGKLVVSGSADQSVRLWDAAEARERVIIGGLVGQVTSVAISGDGKFVVSGSEDHTVRLWEVASGREVAVLKGHTDKVTSVATTRDGKLVASGSEDDSVRVWDVARATEKLTLKGHDAEVLAVALSGDGKLLASASGEGTVKLWDLATGREKATLQGDGGKVTSLAISRDGKLLVAGSSKASAKLWDIP